MFLLIVALLALALLGYLAQSTGLCMVRGVKECKNGNPAFLLAIMFSGSLAWVAALLSYLFDIPWQLNSYQASLAIALGGLIYGLGTAVNDGCGISTLSRLARGELAMLATITGWLAGWWLFAFWQDGRDEPAQLTTDKLQLSLFCAALFGLTLSISIWALLGDRQRKKLWFGMMGIGMLAGFMFLYQASWPPSSLLHDLTRALSAKSAAQPAVWPELSRYALLVALISGMVLAAWRSASFKLRGVNTLKILRHLVSGTCMGVGASLALGGNDSQLLIALPSFSPAGLVAVTGMLVGIWLVLTIKDRLKSA